MAFSNKIVLAVIAASAAVFGVEGFAPPMVSLRGGDALYSCVSCGGGDGRMLGGVESGGRGLCCLHNGQLILRPVDIQGRCIFGSPSLLLRGALLVFHAAVLRSKSPIRRSQQDGLIPTAKILARLVYYLSLQSLDYAHPK